jgi:hypothetical protein
VIACIIEGQGDEKALPILIRRIARALPEPKYPEFPGCLRVGRDKIVKPGELEGKVDLAARKFRFVGGDQAGGGVLVLLDADQDCPAELGPALTARAQGARPDVAVSVVIAKRELEAWFLAGAASLRGQRELAPDLSPPSAAEEVASAKEWLGKRMPLGRSYKPPLDQPALAELVDLDQAREGSASFARCWREIVRLLTGSRP